MKNIFSSTEAAEYLGISLPALKYHIRLKHVKPEMVGNSLVFTRKQLDKFKSTKRPPGRPRKETK